MRLCDWLGFVILDCAWVEIGLLVSEGCLLERGKNAEAMDTVEQ